jgi:hypothetical protein
MRKDAMISRTARLLDAPNLAVLARVIICAVVIVAMSGCIDASYWLNQKSPLPNCFAINSSVRNWNHPRIYYALTGDEVAADVWDGLLHHVHARGRIVKTEPDNGGALVILMNGVCDRYVFRYDLKKDEDTIYVAPTK